MRTPPLVVTFRIVTVAVTLLILLGFGLGLAGFGPVSGLHGLVGDGADSRQAAYVTGAAS